MSFEMMCFLTVIVIGVGIWIYGWIQNNVEVQPKKAAKHAPYAPSTPLPQPTAFNTSSLNVPPVNNIGKPLTIQNWDRLTGMMVMVLGRRWIVTRAMHTLYGYECVFETAGIAHTINIHIYGDMYDSHRVSVFCKGKVALIDVNVCKDPNNLLHSIAVEFTDKFDIWN
jgi:hypothetical protein